MSQALRQRLFDALDSIVLIDPHTHINPLQPASKNLADVLGYHYYTELAHSAGMPRERIEQDAVPAKERVARLVSGLGPLDNTVQYSWLVEIAQVLLGFKHDAVTSDNWEGLYDTAEKRMGESGWAKHVMQQSKLEAMILTNDFDDPLTGFDTKVFVPCLRADELVFRLGAAGVRKRLDKATGISVDSAGKLRQALGKLVTHFVGKGCRACAVSLPPDFAPVKVEAGAADRVLQSVLRSDASDNSQAGERDLSHFVLWTLAELCAEHRLPFSLMIGVSRDVYPGGVYQGHDLFDSRMSLMQYRHLFNAFPQVKFPVSVLAGGLNQELTSFAWIFPNVISSGHWWYSNTPTLIERDAAARLEAVPRTKQIGYYSDMYKLEFALPKFRMYKRVLAKILAERFVIDRGWSEDRALALGHDVLRTNVERVFFGDER